MFCHNCGTEIVEGHSFCGKCGKAVDDWLKDAMKPPKAGSSAGAKIVAGILWGFIGIVAIAVMLSFVAEKANTPSSSASAAPRVRIPIVRHETQALISGSHIVQPQHYVTYPITIAPAMHNARLSGHFTATGGYGNDLQALITDEDGLVNFKNGHQAKVYYQSGKVTADSFDVRLAPGTYYLVFNNVFSLMSNKAYDADVKLDFDRDVFQ